MRTHQSGNFLLQALLALTCIFAFMPFVATRLATRDTATQMYASTRQIDIAHTAARIFVRENANALAYNQTVFSGNNFVDTLEPYGLPLGFIPRTAMGQNISLVVDKDATNISAYLKMTGGDMSGVQLAEMARRIGFYASVDNGDLIVGIALDDAYSDVVRRNDIDLDSGAFLADLNMGGYSLENIGGIIMRRGEFETGEFTTLSLVGTENGRKVKNAIKTINTDKSVFQSADGTSALSLTRGSLSVASVDARTVAAFGDTGNFTARSAATYDFAMTAGRTSFTGPNEWNVHGNVVSDKINFSVERLEISSFLNASRGQDVYINTDTLEYSANSGIQVGSIATSNITMRDQTSDALSQGQTGAVILDIRPAGTSILPDILVNGIDNAAFAIIASPSRDSADTIDCRSVISSTDSSYNAKSLAQYVVCQYMYWVRLEQRIDIKQCLLDGKSDCE